MKRIMTMMLAVASVAAVWADEVPAEYKTVMNSTVTDVVYNDPTVWGGGKVPYGGIDGLYGYINMAYYTDLTLRAPMGGLVENSGTVIADADDNKMRTLTFDTRGTYWEKRGVKSVKDWFGFVFAYKWDYTSHLFNFEGLSKVENDDLIWGLRDGVFKWTTQNHNHVFELISGIFSFDKTLMTGSTCKSFKFIIYPEASIQANGQWTLRDNSSSNETLILGGTHSVGYLYMKDGNCGGRNTYLTLTNDAVLTVKNNIGMAQRNAGNSQAYLNMWGTSQMKVSNMYLTEQGTNLSHFAMHDAAKLQANEIYLAAMGKTYANSTSILEVADNASVTASGLVWIGSTAGNKNAYARLLLRDNAYMTSEKILRIGGGENADAAVELSGNARYDKTGVNWIQIAINQNDAGGKLILKDNAVMTMEADEAIEMTQGGESQAEVNLSGNAQLLMTATSSNASTICNKSEIAGNTKVAIADEAVIETVSVRGYKDGDPSVKVMDFTANGGTLRAIRSSSKDAPTALIAGCNATLGAGGLTIDTQAYNTSIIQDFGYTDGGATITKLGSGVLTVQANSEHPITYVADGVLEFGEGVTQFGNKLIISDSAVLRASDTITADELKMEGTLKVELKDMEDDEVFTLFALTTPLTAAQLNNIIITNPKSGQDYELTTDEDGVKVTAHVATGGEAKWNGSTSTAWHTADNWDSSTVPTHNTIAKFAATPSASYTVDIASTASANMLDVQTAQVTLSGAELYVANGVTVADDAALTIDAPLSNSISTPFTKNGNGPLAIAGVAPCVISNNAGIVNFTTAESIAGEQPLASAGTIRYSGDTAASTGRRLSFTGELPTIIEVVGTSELTFAADCPVSEAFYGFAKTGSGTLKMNVGENTTLALSSISGDVRKGNADTSGTFVPDSFGNAINWNGLAQMSIFDGVLEINGKSKDTSIVKQVHHGLIGGSGVESENGAQLRVSNCSMTQGSGGGFHMIMGNAHVAGKPGPTLLLTNAYFTCNGLTIGAGSCGLASSPARIAITNSTLNVDWQFSMGNYNVPLLMTIGPGGKFTRISSTLTGGMSLNHRFTINVDDGGQIDVRQPQAIHVYADAKGAINVTNKGKISTSYLEMLATSTSNTTPITLDDGCMEFTQADGISSAKNGDATYFDVLEGGAEFANAVAHTLAIPVKGAGRATKTGAGALTIASPLTTTTVKTLQNEGGMLINAGTVTASEETVSDGYKFGGAGTLIGNFNTLGIIAGDDAITLRDVSATKFQVDFGKARDDESIENGSTFVVAHLDGTTSFNATAWRGVNMGNMRSASFTCSGSDVIATVRKSGFMIMVR